MESHRTKVSFDKMHRTLYIKDTGELFIQFRPGELEVLKYLRGQVENGDVITYTETIGHGHFISGHILRVTCSGILLSEWSIK